MYLKDVETSFSRPERNYDGGETSVTLSVFSCSARMLQDRKTAQWSKKDKDTAFWYILNNCDEVEPFKAMLKPKSLLMKKIGNKPSAKNVTTELQLEHPPQQQKKQPQQSGKRLPQQPAKRLPQQPANRQPQQLGKRQPQPPQLQQPEPSQQRQPQPPLHSSESADHDMSSKGKKTRGVTKGIGTHDIVTASNERILIQMNEDQKLPNGVQANSRFVSEIESRTRSLAPLHVKIWKEVTLEVKDEIKKGLLHKFDVNFKEPGIAKFVEDKMNNTFRSWKGKLHKHFKKYADDIDFARAHPPTEKVFGDRDISDWEWLCDNLYTDQAYQNRCRINTINRNKKIYNHCGGSRPFTKHMEAEE
ncbi:hypothetical protein RchiOBHm_Chr5g0040531 [Rosa chinensis]|uniref:Transposase, Ptta/En/Spm, plant n=1 Tax=Rosa chinensis TaxID=74649 RepID=A0A2P6QCJ5_ROSCH|nr:uncharacterized protein LOC112167186 [Rosa chinensis]XP_024159925.1 uncharacterized protein LOC112167186 [Rosa chinensis]XP_040362723.1 uncharacterized protein LOC112167186 [Rosa chinensis]XP_040362724.1 uncharacterized protein LOC112167186 [Rosa chinensis]XP_040362725.1 uncharacterized protein LOC112167186 [Rosa chinensis]XP_040362726.1 uncharacterized protein LOC112167186 [Rosa chinensis]XP_040362727.1 uncharacterized protein LOC112167186 [Rosa chinensis]PRQ31903.1 hypothetical protein 